MGYSALEQNTTGGSNTAVGYKALEANTTASSNTAVGYQAGYSNTTGASNTHLGKEAGKPITTGVQNTMLGNQSGNQGSAAQSYSTFLGEGTGYSNSGNYNTYIGHRAGVSMTSGAKNTILGCYNGNEDGLDIRTASNNIVLSDGDGNVALHYDKSDNEINFGKMGVNADSDLSAQGNILATNIGTAFGKIAIATNCGNFTSAYAHHRFYNGNGLVGHITTTNSATAYNTSSDYRLKENVVYDWDATTRLKQLKPARFNFIADADTTVDGFLAHEAQAVVPEAVSGTYNEVDDDDGAAVMQGIDQSKLVPLLVKTIQELEARITALEGN
jgi:hypothetical protein